MIIKKGCFKKKRDFKIRFEFSFDGPDRDFKSSTFVFFFLNISSRHLDPCVSRNYSDLSSRLTFC